MTAHQLRSRNWFGRNDLDGFVHRSWLKAEGFSDAVFDGRSVVGIANSWSELTNCQWLRRAEYPELPGCFAEAESAVEAIENLESERRRLIRQMSDRRVPVPAPRPPLRRT